MSVSFGQGALAEGLNAQMGVVERMLAAQVSFDDLQVDPATSHLAQAGGKRLRPLLVLLAAQLGPRPQDPAVYDAAVVSVPDDYLGERSCAFIIPRGERPRPAELKKWIRAQGLADFKVPDQFVFVDHFVETAALKLSRKALRAHLRAQLDEKA